MSVRRRSIPLCLFGAAILMSPALGSQSASAQWFGDFVVQGPIPPQRVLAQLRRRGFSDISRPLFDGSVYLIEGLNPRGLRVRLVIDAYDGEILERQRLADPMLREGTPGRIVRLDPSAPPRLREPSRVEQTEPPRTRKKARVEPPRGAKIPGASTQPGQANVPQATPAAPLPGKLPSPTIPGERGPAPTAAIMPPDLPVVPTPVVPVAPAPAASSKAEPPPAGSPSAAEPSSEQRSVRVIEGVTPIGPAPNPPASESKQEDESAAVAPPPPQWRDVPVQNRP